MIGACTLHDRDASYDYERIYPLGGLFDFYGLACLQRGVLVEKSAT